MSEDPRDPSVPLDPDDRVVNPSRVPSLADLVARRLDRRQALGLLGGAALGAAWPARLQAARTNEDPSSLDFEEPENVITDGHRVAAGYRAELLVRWGEPVVGTEALDPRAPDGDRQERCFGYNNDFLGFFPLPRGSRNSDHGLLWVNHEYTSPELMWSGLRSGRDMNADQVAVDMAAHGGSVLEIRRESGSWRVVPNGDSARRVTPHTEMRLSGPAAGHRRLRTAADPSGERVFGTFNNCAGGVTPWGTVLVAEENVNGYFEWDGEGAGEEQSNHERMGIGRARYGWFRHHDRFDVGKEPREPNRFGWMVELDPYDPDSVPVKRTALGRFKHEGATVALDHDGRVVVYCGDDQQFEFLYKFVSDARFDADDPAAARDILDHGTLFVARFDAGGGLRWLPLVFGSGPLTPANDFHDQGDVLVETRRAATLLGATPMDRPEDVEPNPVNGRVYLALTNNTARTEEQVDPANPRARNEHGHIIELVPPTVHGRAHHAALHFQWEIFIRAGDPADAEDGARYHPETSPDGWFSCPDNVAFDPRGRLWIATDQGGTQARRGIPDGVRATDVSGPGRALPRLFFAAPRGAELCGPWFTPDGETLFVAVQHPGEGLHPDLKTRSTFDDPCTRWPDFEDGTPPRPAVVAITRKGGGRIGG